MPPPATPNSPLAQAFVAHLCVCACADDELGVGKRHQELGIQNSQGQEAEAKYQQILRKKYDSLTGKLREDDAKMDREAIREAYDVLKDETKRTLYDQGGNEAVRAGSVIGIEIRFVSEECRVILERVVKAGLAMQVFFSRDEDEIFVTLGAAERILMDEATYAPDPDGFGNRPMHIPLKLKYKDPVTGKTDDRPNGTNCTCTCPVCHCVLLRASWLSTRCVGRFFPRML